VGSERYGWSVGNVLNLMREQLVEFAFEPDLLIECQSYPALTIGEPAEIAESQSKPALAEQIAGGHDCLGACIKARKPTDGITVCSPCHECR